MVEPADHSCPTGDLGARAPTHALGLHDRKGRNPPSRNRSSREGTPAIDPRVRPAIDDPKIIKPRQELSWPVLPGECFNWVANPALIFPGNHAQLEIPIGSGPFILHPKFKRRPAVAAAVAKCKHYRVGFSKERRIFARQLDQLRQTQSSF